MHLSLSAFLLVIPFAKNGEKTRENDTAADTAAEDAVPQNERRPERNVNTACTKLVTFELFANNARFLPSSFGSELGQWTMWFATAAPVKTHNSTFSSSRFARGEPLQPQKLAESRMTSEQDSQSGPREEQQ